MKKYEIIFTLLPSNKNPDQLVLTKFDTKKLENIWQKYFSHSEFKEVANLLKEEEENIGSTQVFTIVGDVCEVFCVAIKGTTKHQILRTHEKTLDEFRRK